MPFCSSLVVEPILGSNNRILVRPFVYQHPITKKVIIVPVGFKTNYASIPKRLRWFIDEDDPIIREAAVIHDYLYSNSSRLPYPEYNRKDADYILYIAMKELESPTIKAYIVYLMVRLFGSSNWEQ